MTTTSTDISKAQKIFNEKYVVNRKAAKKLNLSSLGLKGDLVVKDFEKLKSLNSSDKFL
jgi:hypothetical protein